jgi:hypothetical protein
LIDTTELHRHGAMNAKNDNMRMEKNATGDNTSSARFGGSKAEQKSPAASQGFSQ